MVDEARSTHDGDADPVAEPTVHRVPVGKAADGPTPIRPDGTGRPMCPNCRHDMVDLFRHKGGMGRSG